MPELCNRKFNGGTVSSASLFRAYAPPHCQRGSSGVAPCPGQTSQESKMSDLLSGLMADVRSSDSYVRRLRNLVYDQPTTDANWEHCGPKWREPENVKWLEDEAMKVAEKAK